MSSESQDKLNQYREPNTAASLRACLVDGDSDQRTRNRRLRRRSLLVSVVVQIAVLAALVLVPILSKTERIALANVMPMPPYHRVVAADHTPQRPHPAASPRVITFCLSCPPSLVNPPTPINDPGSVGNDSIGFETDDPNIACSDCLGLISKGSPNPVAPDDPAPHIVYVTHLDPAMLIHRIDPVYPTLARQTARQGRVELQAIIATDGSVRSLQWIGGDALFYQSTLDAVRQWRYKPTFLNGNPVEVDTHITVIYKINR